MGQRLARHAEEVGLMEARLSKDLGLRFPDTPRARITVNADSLASWIVPALAEARLAMPDLLFDVVVDDQAHSAESLKRGEVVGAITATPHPPTGCDSYPLGSLRYVATASQMFMKRYFAQGVTGAALAVAPMLTYDEKDRLQMDWLAHNFGLTRMPPTHYLPSTTAFIEAASRGLGWGMNPEPLVLPALRDRRLVPLIMSSTWDTPLFWQIPRRLRDALAPLTHAIRKVAAGQLHR